MRLGYLALTGLWSLASATILQNGQVKEDPYPGQAPQIALDDSWTNYDAGAPEIAYKGRWDSKHISCTLDDPFIVIITLRTLYSNVKL